MSTRLSAEEREQREHKDFFSFLAAQQRVAELEAENDAARRALHGLALVIGSFVAVVAQHPELLDVHESIRYVYVDAMNVAAAARAVLSGNNP